MNPKRGYGLLWRTEELSAVVSPMIRGEKCVVCQVCRMGFAHFILPPPLFLFALASQTRNIPMQLLPRMLTRLISSLRCRHLKVSPSFSDIFAHLLAAARTGRRAQNPPLEKSKKNFKFILRRCGGVEDVEREREIERELERELMMSMGVEVTDIDCAV